MVIQKLNNFYNPFFRFRYPYYSYNHPTQKIYNSTSNGSNYQTKTEKYEQDKKNVPTDMPLFEFEGIKLFSDDLLILLLIFFLYKEEIDDLLLYVALFALLFP